MVLVFNTEQRLAPQQVRQLWNQITAQFNVCNIIATPIILHSGMKLTPLSQVVAKRGDLEVHGRNSEEVADLFSRLG